MYAALSYLWDLVEHRGREEGRKGIQRHPMGEQPQRGGEHFYWGGGGEGEVDGFI